MTSVNCFSYLDLSIRTSIRNLLSFLHLAANGQAGNPICLFIGSKTVLDQLITSFFISSAFFLRDKCLHHLRFGTRVSRCSFSANSRGLLRSAHPCGFCKWYTFWVIPLGSFRCFSPARLILAIFLRCPYVHPFFFHPFS